MDAILSLNKEIIEKIKTEATVMIKVTVLSELKKVSVDGSCVGGEVTRGA